MPFPALPRNLSKIENVYRITLMPKNPDTPPAKLTPHQVAMMRLGIMTRVKNQLDEAHSVVMGDKEWSPTQARVFATLLNKVMPDLTAQFVQHEHALAEAPEKMSRSQLEAIASGMNNIIDAEVLDDEEADTCEPAHNSGEREAGEAEAAPHGENLQV